MIADVLRNVKLNPIVTGLLMRGRKLRISFFLYYTILVCCAKKYYSNFYALFYYENFKQTRTSTNRI